MMEWTQRQPAEGGTYWIWNEKTPKRNPWLYKFSQGPFTRLEDGLWFKGPIAQERPPCIQGVRNADALKYEAAAELSAALVHINYGLVIVEEVVQTSEGIAIKWKTPY